MYEMIADELNDEFGTARTGDQLAVKRRQLLKREKEQKEKPRKIKKRKRPRRLTGLDLAMKLLKDKEDARAEERRQREEIRRTEALEREERIFLRLEKLAKSLIKGDLPRDEYLKRYKNRAKPTKYLVVLTSTISHFLLL